MLIPQNQKESTIDWQRQHNILESRMGIVSMVLNPANYTTRLLLGPVQQWIIWTEKIFWSIPSAFLLWKSSGNDCGNENECLVLAAAECKEFIPCCSSLALEGTKKLSIHLFDKWLQVKGNLKGCSFPTWRAASVRTMPSNEAESFEDVWPSRQQYSGSIAQKSLLISVWIIEAWR